MSELTESWDHVATYPLASSRLLINFLIFQISTFRSAEVSSPDIFGTLFHNSNKLRKMCFLLSDAKWRDSLQCRRTNLIESLFTGYAGNELVQTRNFRIVGTFFAKYRSKFTSPVHIPIKSMIKAISDLGPWSNPLQKAIRKDGNFLFSKPKFTILVILIKFQRNIGTLE